jgi:hypothetical protein
MVVVKSDAGACKFQISAVESHSARAPDLHPSCTLEGQPRRQCIGAGSELTVGRNFKDIPCLLKNKNIL